MTNNLQQLYQDCLEYLNAEEILNHYGAKNISHVKGRKGPELLHSCVIDKIIPHHNNGDSSPSAMMNEGNLLYNCFSFGGGDIFWFLQQMEQTEDPHVIRQVLSKFLQGSTENKKTLIDRLEEIFNQRGQEVKTEIPHYHEKVLQPWLKLHPYLYKDREISVEVLRKYKIGYDENEARIVIPHYVDGKLVGWQKRKMTDCKYPQSDGKIFGMHYIPKYQNSSGFPKAETLYNYDSVKGSSNYVLVVESPLSVLRLLTIYAGETPESRYRIYVNSYSMKLLGRVVATFGAKVTSEQVKLLRGFKKVVVFFDPDIAGWQGSLKILKELREHVQVECIIDSKLMGDPADIPVMELNRLLSNPTPAPLAIIQLQQMIDEKLKEKRNGNPQTRVY